MTASASSLPFDHTIPAPPAAKRRVLLVDSSRAKRDLRAETMRKLGMDVDCAVDIAEARYWWRADVYHLVLLDVRNELGHRDSFCEDISGAKPPQQFAFLVGAPDYLADSPAADVAASVAPRADVASANGLAAKGEVNGISSQRWGILEASRRISAVRSLFNARTQAKQNRPAPPRDSEIRYSRRVAADSPGALPPVAGPEIDMPEVIPGNEIGKSEILKEELQ